MTESIELLFFDTFAHDNSEELNLDLVQFPKPVYVTEVRIIPLGARVQADFPGGVRLGATNPSQFRIEFFVNDLGKRGASTFESLGGFEYNQNGCINLECVPDDTVRKIPTDGLVLRGWYTTITLAVYGTLTANIAEQIASPAVTPALPAQSSTIADVQQIVPQTPLESEWPQENIQPVSIEYSQQPATQYVQNYNQPEPYPQEYNEYYNEVPKDPRSYHQTPDSEWDNKPRSRSIEIDRERDRTRDQPYQKPLPTEHDHRPEADRRERDRERRYSRSHSRDRDRDRSSRDYPDGRERDHDRDREWDHDRHEYRDRNRDRDRDRDRDRERDRERERERDRDRERGDRDRDRDRSDRDRDRTERDRERDRERERDKERSYEHQDNYRRTYNREERDEVRKRPRTPPMVSPKRPHTPHMERKELSPQEVEVLSEEELHLEKQKREKEEVLIKASVKSPAKEIKEVQSPVVEEPPPMDAEEFEPILSDEDIVDDEHYQELDYDYTAYTNNDDIIKQFIPGSTDLQKYPTPALFSIKDTIELDEELKIVLGIADDFFKSSITEYKLKDFIKLDREIKEELVHLCEKVMTTITNVNHFCHIIEIYCKTKNCTRNFNESDKEIIGQVKFITETLLDWIIIALDYRMANEQYKPCYKIRHIKCGIKLTEWCCNSLDFIKLLWSNQFYIDKVLLNLYQIEYMALSIKLMILRALDKYLQKRETIEKFISKAKQNGFYENIEFSEQNGYKTLIELMQKNPLVRLKFALNSIIKKLNIFEVLQKLYLTVTNVKNENHSFNSDEIKFITKSIGQILNCLQNEHFALSQPKRFLPVAAQFEINNIDADNVLINFFRMNNLLGVFLILLTLPNTMNRSSIKSPICEILSQLLMSEEGLEYLTENYEISNVIVKTLIQTDEDLQFDSLEMKSYNLGLEIAYKVQAIYHLDALRNLGKNGHDYDNFEVINNLHGLFCLIFNNIGKISVAEVLTLNNNLDVLLNYIEIISERIDNKYRKSPSICYIVDLIYLSVSCVINIGFLEKYTSKIMLIIKQHDLFENYVANKLMEIEPYLRSIYDLEDPLRYDDISSHVDIINKHLDLITNYPPEVIISLNVIKYLGISRFSNKSPVLSENPLSNYIELKYKHVILQLYSLDGVNLLLKILSKICNYYEQPSLHTHIFVSNQGVQIVNIIQPTIELLKQMLTYVIQCRSVKFKDLTAVPILLQTFNLLKTFPSNSLFHFKTNKIRKNIIDTLLVYTQPVSDEIQDSLNKSLWSLMCGEVIKYVTTAPYTFISGLLIFSELLPLPLPINTLEQLNSDEISWVINLRKLWSAHLHTHSNSIQEILNHMCITTNQNLMNLLRRVCVQLGDLAANSATMISRGILDAIYTVLTPKDDSKIIICNNNTTRLLNFLACLMTHSPLKCATLQLLHNTTTPIKGDEKYPMLVEYFCQVLKTNNNSSSHIQAQECVLSIIQSFCDTEITLYQNFTEETLSSEKFLSNALPIKEHLVMYISTIIEHLSNENTFVTYLPTMRILLLLTEHDYGFYYLKENLLKKKNVFGNIFKYIEKNFSKDNDDCLTALNILLQFLKCTLSPEEVDVTVLFKPRMNKLNLEDVQNLIDWKVEENTHPLRFVEEQLKDIVKEDASFENLLSTSSWLVKQLDSNRNEEKENYQECILPPPEPLLTQFAGRIIYTIGDGIDQRLTSSFWLSPPSEENETDVENVTCDLLEICRQHLSQDTNLIREVEKVCRIYAIDKTEQAEKEKLTDQQKDKIKRPFVPNVRGRGFPRTIPQRADLFRSRPPNTSRPPSLHVDDFVALETCGAQPTGPTGYNKLSRDFLATTRVVRGTRGRPFITQERTMQYRQMSWWGTPMGRGPYH